MRNKWTLSGDLKSPGVKPVPVRFRLAAPRNSRTLIESCGDFFAFSACFCNPYFSFCPMRVGKKFAFAGSLPTNQHQNVLRAEA